MPFAVADIEVGENLVDTVGLEVPFSKMATDSVSAVNMVPGEPAASPRGCDFVDSVCRLASITRHLAPFNQTKRDDNVREG